MTCPSFSGIELLSAFQLLRKLLIFTLPKRKRGLMSRARYNGEETRNTLGLFGGCKRK